MLTIILLPIALGLGLRIESYALPKTPFTMGLESPRSKLSIRMLGKKGGHSGSTSGGKGFDASFSRTWTGSQRPGVKSPPRTVPEGVMLPDYAITGIPAQKTHRFPWVIEVKSNEEVQGMRKAGKLAREVLDLAGKAVVEGAKTDDIDRIVHVATTERGAYPSTLNYRGFPKSCCTSLNEVICHGIPDTTILKEGDILNIDVTVYFKGFHGDCSEMFCVGEVDEKAKELIRTTYWVWKSAADFCQPGKQYSEIGGIIESYVASRGYSTVKAFCGHGIGKVLHTNPDVLHYKNSDPNGIMKVGHTFTIEPMICEGTAEFATWPDNWVVATADGRRSAQFEHTFLMTESGLEALTAKLPSSPRQWWEIDWEEEQNQKNKQGGIVDILSYSKA